MHTVALGLTKAMHKFLTLHYFATDSAARWDDVLAKPLPHASLLNTDERRQAALDMFYKCHIAPSYRRVASLQLNHLPQCIARLAHWSW